MAPADAEALYAIQSDPKAMRFWNTPPHPGLDHTRERLLKGIEADRSGDSFWWGIERKEDGRLLGTVTVFFNGSQREHRAELGYILGREHWGSGYMNEAQSAVLDYAFGELALHRLEADVDPANEASLRSLERLGFKREGLLRERWEVAGEITDSVLLGLLAREWLDRPDGE